MEITRNCIETLYHLEDIRGNIICSFHELKAAVLVRRFIEGNSLTEEQENYAMGCIELHDEEEQRINEELEARKEADAGEQKEGVAE